MVVVVIIGLLAAVAMPRLSRDRLASEGRNFASELARDLQRAKSQAVSTRLPVHAFVYRNTVKFKSATQTTPSAPPTAPSADDAVSRPFAQLRAPAGVNIHDVLRTVSTPSLRLDNVGTFVQIEFTTLGQARIVQSPALQPGGLVYVYIENVGVTAVHPERRFRIDITGLTGYVTQRPLWP